MTGERAIGVGVGGAGGWQALAWAAEEAERSEGRLVLLHVCAPGSPLLRAREAPAHADVELVDPPLSRAYTSTQSRLGGQRVALRIRGGDPATALVDASAGVRLLVIGAGAGGRTVRRIIRHAHCPVVVVRPDLPARPDGPLAGHVVIGVDGSAAGRAALEFAVAYAAEHRAPLAAVHVAESEHADHYPDGVTPEATAPEALRLLAGETRRWTSRGPAPRIRHAVLHGPVSDALIRAGGGARLLVVGDKRRGAVGRARTGDVPLTVAAGAPCPVTVVPADQQEGVPL
ncbi:universal stress protein [Amorphoplanes nipponensis]|uniref:Universal stress protein n=1 Tax=Actinoplanes nipponensis TaxID=135950 RepID=A0A919MTZ1_9ACTN|nr:universal stress protein [Actinoplanes nipponensis]GIE54108.1 universal stress protein [Actinoplanes nipponensis]